MRRGTSGTWLAGAATAWRTRRDSRRVRPGGRRRRPARAGLEHVDEGSARWSGRAAGAPRRGAGAGRSPHHRTVDLGDELVRSDSRDGGRAVGRSAPIWRARRRAGARARRSRTVRAALTRRPSAGGRFVQRPGRVVVDDVIRPGAIGTCVPRWRRAGVVDFKTDRGVEPDVLLSCYGGRAPLRPRAQLWGSARGQRLGCARHRRPAGWACCSAAVDDELRAEAVRETRAAAGAGRAVRRTSWRPRASSSTSVA